MKINVKKNAKQFTVSMILETNVETISEENLQHINTHFINEFVKKESLFAENKLEKRKPLLIGFAIASGNQRDEKAIELALLPLLLNVEIKENSNSVLLQISSHTIELNIDEIGLINDYIQEKLGHNADIIMTVCEDENLGEALAITIILSEK